MNRMLSLAAVLVGALVPAAAAAHAPSVVDDASASSADVVVLDDPTLSRALGATIGSPGEIDWYRMDLEAGDPLVVGMTAPDAQGGIAATFTLLGPGLPPADEAGAEAARLADEVGVEGAIVFEPALEPAREVHGGLGFINFGTVRLEAPADGSYYVAVEAVDPDATGKYVLAPGVREEFGIDAVGGMIDLVAFFNAAWPPPAGS
jgi:hypothetical protein